MKRFATTVVLCVFFIPAALALQESPNQKTHRLKAVRINENIELTGRLTDPRWALAPEVPVTFEIQPGENTPATQQTTVKILYNAEYFYAGFICRETDMKQLRANVTDRDKIFEDDFAVLIIDTFGDKQRGYEFFVNPVGIQGDILRSGSNEDDSWDAIWHSSAVVTDSMWTVEMAIPFKSIRFPPEKVQNWILLAGRNYPRSSRAVFSWTPFDRNDPCFLCQGGVLEGIQDIEATTAIEVLPYIVGSQSSALNNTDNPSSGFANGDLRGRIGGGVKYSPNPGLVVDAVLNPDFSQVESDASQISVNTTFALFYQERRPFFLEGTDLFNTRITGFYSRMVNNPIAAAKLTQKSGAFSLALLSAADRNAAFIIPGEESSSFVNTELNSVSTIARARYDTGNESFIGALGTARNTGSAYNYIGGMDWNYLFAGNYYFRGQILASTTKEVNDLNVFDGTRTFRNTEFNSGFNGETFSGTAVDINFRKSARDFSYGFNYRDFSPTFHAYNGFITRNDFRSIDFNPSYSFYPNGAVVEQAYLFASTGMQFNHAGQRKERWLVLGGGMQMKAQTFWEAGFLAVNQELFKGVYFPDLPRMFFFAQTRPVGSLSFSLNGDAGRYIYRDDIPELGAGHNISVSTTIKPTDKFQLSLNYSRSQLSSVATGALYFDGYIARAVGVYQFSPEFFIRLISEYNQFDKAIQLYPLVSYKLNPFTIFYAGSTHNLQEFDTPYGVEQTERQFFLKLQYLWRN